ncbi:hypothetical protein EDF60_1586 [Leucobacter luti]|nr:hypothetical protein [Leucobacter luti]TCK41168.1 hypothetical protein EDF60_1586 [Leucobacter luti]
MRTTSTQRGIRALNVSAIIGALALVGFAPTPGTPANALWAMVNMWGPHSNFGGVQVHNSPFHFTLPSNSFAQARVTSWDYPSDIYRISMGLRNSSHVQVARWETYKGAQGSSDWYAFKKSNGSTSLAKGTYYINFSADKTHGAPHSRKWYGQLNHTY